jgi:hypothetical protein
MLVPGSSTPLLAHSAAAAATGISRSLRFNSSDSAYCSRVPASAGNRKTWTWAGWVKRSGLGGLTDTLMDARTGSNESPLCFNESVENTLSLYEYNSSYIWQLRTTQVFRDPSSWYHIVASVDTTQATAANRVRLYVNGTQITAFAVANYPSQNHDTFWNTTNPHVIGQKALLSGSFYDGYLADIYFIDGQALTPSSFTETDATTGQLIPKAYTGSYGTNGWHLEFADNSSNTATTLGKDTSGNGNNWTPNNLSVTAGAGNDSLVDVPTNGAQTDTGVGGEVRGNYATLNPLESANTLSNGNLDVTSGSASWKISASTIYAQTGKWYCEFTLNAVQGYPQIGVYAAGSTFATSGLMGTSSTGYAYNSFNGNKINNNSSSAYGNSWTTGDTIGIAYDLDNGALYFSKNGTWQNSGVPTSGASKTGAAFSLPAGIFYTVAISAYGSDAGSFNFGQRPFAYTAPSGFKALCTANLPAPLVTKPNTVFDTVLYTGTGSTQTISSLQFNPDFLWIKNRDTAGYNHHLTDVVRGVTQRLRSNTTGAELTTTDQVTGYTSTGFTLGADSAGPGDLECNQSSKTYVAWAWDAGSSTDTNNTAGSITSQVRANTSAGFSVLTYSGANGGTVGHGLGVAPSLVIVKCRSNADGWVTYHKDLGPTNTLQLQSTNAVQTSDTTAFNSTAPSSTLVTLGNSGRTCESGRTYVAYCFAPVVGYSSFGSYTGNGSSDGPFVYTGFRPRWVMIKHYSGTISDQVNALWMIVDSARNTYNVVNLRLHANSSAQETNLGETIMDFTSNGFKLRWTPSDVANANGGNYIYAAFAEAPFNYARAR